MQRITVTMVNQEGQSLVQIVDKTDKRSPQIHVPNGYQITGAVLQGPAFVGKAGRQGKETSRDLKVKQVGKEWVLQLDGKAVAELHHEIAPVTEVQTSGSLATEDMQPTINQDADSLLSVPNSASTPEGAAGKVQLATDTKVSGVGLSGTGVGGTTTDAGTGAGSTGGVGGSGGVKPTEATSWYMQLGKLVSFVGANTSLVVAGGAALISSAGGNSGNKEAGGTPAPSTTIVAGTVVLGPVVADGDEGTGLEVQLFDENGNDLGKSTVKSNGSYSINLGKVYTGGLVAVVRDTNGDTVNFWNEATGNASDLSHTILAVAKVGVGTTALNVSHLSTLAALTAGVRIPTEEATDAPTKIVLPTGVNVANAFESANLTTGKALGLGVDVTKVAIVAAIDSSGQYNSKVNWAGKVEAALSVVALGSTPLTEMATQLQADSTLSETNWGRLTAGAKTVANVLGQSSFADALITRGSPNRYGGSIDAVAGDDLVIDAEKTNLQFSGNVPVTPEEGAIFPTDLEYQIISTTRQDNEGEPVLVASGATKVVKNGSATVEGRWLIQPTGLATNVKFLDDTYKFVLLYNDQVIASRYFVLDATPDAPTFKAIPGITLTDTVAKDSFNSVMGQMESTHALGKAVYELDGAVTNNVQKQGVSFTHAKTGSYGTIYINQATGRYFYEVNNDDVNALRDGQKTEEFTMTAKVAGQSSIQALKVTINAVDDKAIITLDNGSQVLVNDSPVTEGEKILKGTLLASDVDTAGALTFEIQGSVGVETQFEGVTVDYKKTGVYGTLYLNSTNGKYFYQTNPMAIDKLKSIAYDEFKVRGGSSDDLNLKITINGVDDTTTLTSTSMAITDTVAEDVFNQTLGLIRATDIDDVGPMRYGIQGGDTLQTRASIVITDVEGAKSNRDFDMKREGQYGTLYLDQATGFYTYDADETKVNALKQGETQYDTFVVTAGTGTRTLALELKGANDVTRIHSVPAISLNDTSADDRFSNEVGRVIASDAEVANLTYDISGSTAASYTSDGVTYDKSKVGGYGTLYLVSTGGNAGKYVFVPNATAINALVENDRKTEDYVFSAKAEAGDVAVTTPLTVNLTGAHDNTRITSVDIKLEDTPADDKFLPASYPNGKLDAQDSEGRTVVFDLVEKDSAPNYVLNGVTYDLKKTTTYGTLHMVSTGVDAGKYVFVPVAVEINALKAGEVKTETFTVSSGGGEGKITVTIEGKDDTPIVTAPPLITYNDTALPDTGLAMTTGTLSASDVDSVGLVYGIKNVSPLTTPVVRGEVSYDLKKVGTYGTLYLQSSSGQYRFEPNTNEVDKVKFGESPIESFLVTARASTGGLAGENLLQVEVKGADDTPIVTAPTLIQVTDTASSTETFLKQTGQLIATDPDTPLTYALTSTGKEGGTYSVDNVTYTERKIATYGTLYLQTSSGRYVYVPNNDKINQLGAENKTEAFAFSVGGVPTSLDVQISGADDAARITPTPVGDNSAIQDLPTPNVQVFRKGSLSLADVDSDVSLLSLIIKEGTSLQSPVTVDGISTYNYKKEGSYGTLYLDSVNKRYVYASDPAKVDQLKSGTQTDSFTVEAGNGSTALEFKINGADDKAVLSIVQIAVEDTPANDASTSKTGSISATDPDDTLITYGLTGGVVLTTVADAAFISNFDVKKVGTYGTLYLKTTTGAYHFQSNATAVNALKVTDTEVTRTEEFAYTTADGGSSKFVVTVTAAGDAPFFTTQAGERTFTEAQGPGAGTAINLGTAFGAVLTDVDGGGVESLKLRVENWVTGDQLRIEHQSGTLTLTDLLPGSVGSFRVGTRDYTYSVTENRSGNIVLSRELVFVSQIQNAQGQLEAKAATVAEFNALVNALSYTNVSNDPGSVNRVFKLSALGEAAVTGGAKLPSNEVTLSIKTVEVDDRPTGTDQVKVKGQSQLTSHTLTADVSSVADLDGPLTWTYQWQYLENGTWVNISGATGSTFTLNAYALNYDLRVSATAWDGKAGHAAVTMTSEVRTTGFGNTEPTLTITSPSELKEAGGVNNQVSGVATATAILNLSDIEDTLAQLSYDATWLTQATNSGGGGWTQSGSVYTKAGLYGTATLNPADHKITYLLNNSGADTQKLTSAQTGNDSFAVRIKDSLGVSSPSQTVVFKVVGADDAPTGSVTTKTVNGYAGNSAWTDSLFGSADFSTVDNGQGFKAFKLEVSAGLDAIKNTERIKFGSGANDPVLGLQNNSNVTLAGIGTASVVLSDKDGNGSNETATVTVTALDTLLSGWTEQTFESLINGLQFQDTGAFTGSRTVSLTSVTDSGLNINGNANTGVWTDLISQIKASAVI